jgi:OOP family OmpA-OmpF porin
MKPDLFVIGVVTAVLTAGVLLAVWLQDDDPLERPVVQELAGPRSSAPVPLAPPAPALPPAPEPVSATVLFEFDRAVLREAEAGKLERLLVSLGAKALRLEAVGHADRIGPADYNLRLSQRRAEAVKAYLVQKNEIDPAAVHTSAKGELEPASGDACMAMGPELRKNTGLVECLQPDRRVEVTVSRGT